MQKTSLLIPCIRESDNFISGVLKQLKLVSCFNTAPSSPHGIVLQPAPSNSWQNRSSSTTHPCNNQRPSSADTPTPGAPSITATSASSSPAKASRSSAPG